MGIMLMVDQSRRSTASFQNQPATRRSILDRAFRMLHADCTKLFFINSESQVVRELYMIVTTLPDADGCGNIKSIDEEGQVIDFCYRIKPDGTVHGWVALDGEHEQSILPLEPTFDENGVMNAFVIRFSCGYTANYRVEPLDEYYYPADEMVARETAS